MRFGLHPAWFAHAQSALRIPKKVLKDDYGTWNTDQESIKKNAYISLLNWDSNFQRSKIKAQRSFD